MIVRTGNRNFLAAHYDWLALGLGVVVLGFGAVFYVSVLGEDPEKDRDRYSTSRMRRPRPRSRGSIG